MGDEGERIERFLRGGEAVADEAAAAGRVLLQAGNGRGAVAVRAEAVERLVAAGRVLREGGTLRLASHERSGDALGARAQEVEAVAAGGEAPVLVNLAESPLGSLARRRGKDGASFLSAAEFDAGERLRADFTRGSMMARLGANWVASVASGKRHGGSGIGDLTDAALAARIRVERALEAVGPELSGVLVDVCCFLKGLEQVESERGWPVRSAKVVLKTALGVLARHYDPGAGKGRRQGGVLHWGAEGYRPKLR